MSQHSAKGAAWEAQRKRVLIRDGWACVMCGKHLDGADATVDHIEPIALNSGKAYSDDELVAMCRACNGRKSDRALTRVAYVSPRWARFFRGAAGNLASPSPLHAPSLQHSGIYDDKR